MTAAEFVNALKNPREHTIVETANGPIIRFDGATLHDCHVFEEIEINYGVVFQGVTFGNFTLQKLKANGFVRFKNCNSYENTIFNVSIETPFDIIIDQNFLFEGRVEFRNCTCNSFKMFGGEFNGGINFLSNSFNIFYFTGNSKIKNDIIFTSNTVGRFSLNGGKIENIKFGSGNTQILSFSKDIEINNCQIRGGRFKTIAFNTSNVRNINNNLLFEPDLEPLIIEILDINNIKNGFLGLSEICNIGEIQFNYGFISKDTIVDISKITVNSLTFYNFINYGQINFKSFTCREQLHFIDSDIGKVTFIGCDFQNALIDFKSSKIIEAFIIGGKFPEKFINKENLDKQGAYSQIKKSTKTAAHKKML
ncbi:MAG: hypothetical protein IPH28_14835 [Cytophagaceae bacterium]|nr:hypothetical protein [Cytophagaceae bacterium]